MLKKIIFTILIFMCSAQVHAEKKMRFGLYVWQRPRLIVEAMRPLLDQMQSDLSRVFGDDVKIEIHLYKDKHKLTQDLVTKKLDMARVDPSMVLAAYFQNTGLQMAGIETQTNTKNIPFVIATSSQSPIQDVTTLEGHSFAFGERGSLLGDRLPEWILFQNLVLTDHLKEIQYVESESARSDLIASGQVEAGVLSKEFFEKKKNLKSIFEYQGILEAWILRDGLSDRDVRAIRDELTYTLRRHPALEKIQRIGFVKGDFADYEVVSQAGELGDALLSQGLGKKNVTTTTEGHHVEK